ncbi:EAL domain-containing protein [Rhodoferax sp.]|uniref:bifunctional diguanylate cyclase/phosphodiesterase n=1 Tax=Rhodoferax sp. TaxID=50421 RepID=UPI0025CEFB72|nr:EAL domain-containing protein [Rhodoferax sp.]
MIFKWQLTKLVPALVALFGLCLTYIYWQNEEREFKAFRQHVFDGVADQMAAGIQRKLSNFELILNGVKGFQMGAEVVSRDSFHAYYQAIEKNVTQSGLQGVALVEHVPQQQLAHHITDARSRGIPDYLVKPLAERGFYTPITVIEPLVGRNLRVPGFDIASNPDILPTLERARDTGQVAITGKLTLVQDEGQPQPAVVMYVPIFKRAMPTDTVTHRQGALQGWVSGPFRVGDMIASVKQQLPDDVALAIFEDESMSTASQLFADALASSTPTAYGLALTRQLDIGDRRWTLAMRALPAFGARFDNDQAHLPIAVTGLAMSLLLGWLAWLLATGRERALALANQMTGELRGVQADLEATLDAMPDVLFEVGLDGRYFKYRTLKTSQLVAPPKVFLGKLVSDVLPEDAAHICLSALQEAHATGFSFGKEIHFPIGSQWYWFELSVARKNTPGDAEPRFIVISRDITERKESLQQLQLNAQVFNLGRDGIVITDEHNKIVSVNQAFTTMTGYEATEVIGKSPEFLSSGRQNQAFFDAVWQKIQAQGYWQGELWNQRKSGEIYPQWLSISAARDATGTISKHIVILADLTESKAAQERIDYLDRYDKLTRLPNHQILQDRTALALATAKRAGKCVVMLFVNIDRFQNINDSLGRTAGDQVIKAIADRLTGILQADDTVCRLGGDEFCVLCPATDADGAAHVADRILRTIKQPVALGDGQELRLTASIGIAVYPENGSDFDRLIQSAGAALVQSKQNGRDGFRFFTDQMYGRAHETLMIENQLRQALAKNEFLLHYQPQIDAQSGRIIGAEALIRWQHAEWGLVPPGRFIPIAESSGQIMEIGDWVLRSVVAQIALWQQEGLGVVPVAVNLSAIQFHQTSLCESIGATLHHSSLPSGLLELELTESIAMTDSDFTADQISKLHDMGVTLSIDDFGTGYSSLSYLTRYKIDKLKIDQSFVRELKTADDESAIVCAIINMAHGLGFKTIAEGVETQVQLDYLRAQGCDAIQGYLFSRPVPAAQFAELLRHQEIKF